MLIAAAVPTAVAAVELADSPLFSSVTVPGNVILALSVEFPTGLSPAYPDSVAYATANTYLGYFDPAKCYKYVYTATTTSDNSYFTPYSITTTRTCASTPGNLLWSGNYLNWASTQTLDAFRWILTGGNRWVDTGTQTILEKTYNSEQEGIDFAANKKLSSNVSDVTPFTWKTVTTRTYGAGTRMWITGTGKMTSSVADTSVTAYAGQPSPSESAIYGLYLRVKVCDSSVGLEPNCVLYGRSTYKPQGLMQQYSNKLRYAAFGYLTDNDKDSTTNKMRDGGVLRARMKYIGPSQPIPGSADTANTAAEWDGTTGIMNRNPDPTDASNTTAASNAVGMKVTITQSGVMNYLNKFGTEAKTYKYFDPVSELYYAALRYLKNLPDVSEYSTLKGAADVAKMTSWLDGFPVITNWTDPMLYSCQKNFILGIGDFFTHRDANLNGSTILNANEEPKQPSAVASDKSINVKTATDMVGKLEGIGSLGDDYVDRGRFDTYFMAGLAYDAHTNDIRSDLLGTQTVNTYWMDVLERKLYANRNVYYLATKYGGFTVPANFEPYSSSNGPTTLSKDTWHVNNDTLPPTGITASPAGITNERPDNYFTGNNPTAMKNGLTAAFTKISSETAETFSTAFSPITPDIPPDVGVTNYATTYDPSTWTGKLLGSVATLAKDGKATSTPKWDARALLNAPAVTSSTRKIVTCCTTNEASPGLRFTADELSAGPLHARTHYASFSAVPGASSQSAANFVAYLRGDTTNEARNGGPYRTRTYRLGDIVNSKPASVGAPSFPFYDLFNPGYSTFKLTYAKRKPVVYVGANDGMLHAFDGTVDAASSGSELFAYVPSFVYGSSTTAGTTGIATLGNPNFTHHYFVDGTPVVVDVDLNKTSGAAGSGNDWRTLLVGGLGKGGKGYYALDVTDPSSWTDETAVKSKVKWEFTDARMGYSYGRPSIVKTKKYGWVVILTSGYNNSDGKGYFFFVNPRTGALLEAVATPSGSTDAPIDLAHQSAYGPDFHDGTADAVYAGDLQGNLWRLDVTGNGAYSAPTLIAKLTNADGYVQPVTTPPLIEIDLSSMKRYVLVGTGKLMADSDINSGSQQSFYAIVDGYSGSGKFYGGNTTGTANTPLPSGVVFPIQRSKLAANTKLLLGVASSQSSTVGWYFDLPVSGSVAERININLVARDGIVGFAGNRPGGLICSPSGQGNKYAVAFAAGKTVLTDSSGNPIEFITSTTGMIRDMGIVVTGNTSWMVSSDASGATDPSRLPPSIAPIKQLNWRDVPVSD